MCIDDGIWEGTKLGCGMPQGSVLGFVKFCLYLLSLRGIWESFLISSLILMIIDLLVLFAGLHNFI